jgi:hypothetical protein
MDRNKIQSFSVYFLHQMFIEDFCLLLGDQMFGRKDVQTGRYIIIFMQWCKDRLKRFYSFVQDELSKSRNRLFSTP